MSGCLQYADMGSVGVYFLHLVGSINPFLSLFHYFSVELDTLPLMLGV